MRRLRPPRRCSAGRLVASAVRSLSDEARRGRPAIAAALLPEAADERPDDSFLVQDREPTALERFFGRW